MLRICAGLNCFKHWLRIGLALGFGIEFVKVAPMVSPGFSLRLPPDFFFPGLLCEVSPKVSPKLPGVRRSCNPEVVELVGLLAAQRIFGKCQLFEVSLVWDLARLDIARVMLWMDEIRSHHEKKPWLKP